MTTEQPHHTDFADAFVANLRSVLAAIPNRQRGVLLHAPTLTTSATTDAELQRLRAESLSFADKIVEGSKYAGVWLATEVGPRGSRHHVHGLIVSPWSTQDVEAAWVTTISNASSAPRVQFDRMVSGQGAEWSKGTTLEGHLRRWLRYCLKPGTMVPSVSADQRVCAVAGRLVRPWGDACTAVWSSHIGTMSSSRCWCGKALSGRQRQHCSKSCANVASRRRDAMEHHHDVLDVVEAALNASDTATTRQLIAAVKAARLAVTAEQVRALLDEYVVDGWVVDKGRKNHHQWAWVP